MNTPSIKRNFCRTLAVFVLLVMSLPILPINSTVADQGDDPAQAGSPKSILAATNAPTPHRFLALPFDDASVHVAFGFNDVNPQGNLHQGIDWMLPHCTPIYAAADGVAMVSEQPGRYAYGTFVYIKHDNGYYTLYAHLDSVSKSIEENSDYRDDPGNEDYDNWTHVKQGELIGYVGRSGTTSYHLHFEVRTDRYSNRQSRVDPYGIGRRAAAYPPRTPITPGRNYLWIDNPPAPARRGGDCGPGQFLAQYYSNRHLSGSPTLTRCEARIDHDWGTGGPGGGVPNDNFSARWTGRFSFSGGQYTFIARADDGIRVWVNGRRIINEWKDQAATTYRATLHLDPGEHEVKVEYYEAWGHAVAQLRWERARSDCGPGQFRAQYYSNRHLSGSPTLTRCEPRIDHDWGTGGPGGGVPNDNFSARWTGRFTFSGGEHTFIARADDGIRVWINDDLIINEWKDQAATTYRASLHLDAGEHEVKVECYEAWGQAVAQLRWETADTCPFYRAEYYDNRHLRGTPVSVRCEEWPIDHDWGAGGPGNGVPNDNFSARWTGRASFETGVYEFVARADDGIRVWLNDDLIIDAWRDQALTEYRTTRSVRQGNHNIRVEYYEHAGLAAVYFRWHKTGGNLALGRPAHATSQESAAYAPSRGNDGNTGTRWSSRISPSLGNERWLTDLGTTQTFDQVVIRWEAAYAAEHCIGWSENGSHFVGYCYNVNAPGNYRYRLGTQQARYVAVYMRRPAPRMNNYSFWEFEVYRGATAAGAGGQAVTDSAGELVPTGDLITLERPATPETDTISPPLVEP